MKPCENARKRKVVLASARPPRVMRHIVRTAEYVDYWICRNGARTYKGQQLIFERSMPAASVAVWGSGVLAEYPEVMVCLEIEDALYSSMAPARFFEEVPWVKLEIESIEAESKVSKIIVEYTRAIETESRNPISAKARSPIDEQSFR